MHRELNQGERNTYPVRRFLFPEQCLLQLRDLLLEIFQTCACARQHRGLHVQFLACDEIVTREQRG